MREPVMLRPGVLYITIMTPPLLGIPPLTLNTIITCGRSTAPADTLPMILWAQVFHALGLDPGLIAITFFPEILVIHHSGLNVLVITALQIECMCLRAMILR